MHKSVLITGAFGYLGGQISAYLLENTDYEIKLGTRNPNNRAKDDVRVVWIDVLSEESLNTACYDVDAVIHLAALNEIESASNPEKALLVNGLGTMKLLEAAKSAGAKRFIYFSTAHVYGSLEGVIDEGVVPRPLHPYAITHRLAEDYVLAAHGKGDLVGIALRLSNAIGPPADLSANRWSLIGNDLCRQIVKTGNIVLRSVGLQERDFIPLSDVPRAVHHFLELPKESCQDGLFNLGGEKSSRIIDLAELIASRSSKVLGISPAIQRPVGAGITKSHLEYKVEKINRTGFQLEGDISEEIDNTLKFCSKFRSAL